MPLFWLSLAFILGVFIGDGLPLPSWAWPLAAGLALGGAGAFYFLQRARARPPSPTQFPFFYLLIPLSLALGAARYQAAQPDLTDPAFIAAYVDIDQAAMVTGLVIEPPLRHAAPLRLRLRVETVALGEAAASPAHGLLMVEPLEGAWQYGDRVQFSGRLQRPYEGEAFSYRDYLRRQSIYAVMRFAEGSILARGQGNPLRQAVYTLKSSALVTVERLWPEPEASLFAGILLGEESGIAAEVAEDFRTSGTSHIIAISGFNISILAGLFVAAFGRLLGRRWGALAAILGIAFYTLLVGAEASVVRAAIMGGLGLFGRQLGRRQDGLNSLAAAAAAMTLHNPLVLLDIGFQLSFTATLGLILYAEPFQLVFIRALSRFTSQLTALRLSGLAGEYLLFTLAVQLTSLPVILYHFGQPPGVGTLANLLILPAQPAVMVLGGASLLLGLAFLPLGRLAAFVAWPFCAFTIRAVQFFAGLAGTLHPAQPVSLLAVGLYYAALLYQTFGPFRLPRWNLAGLLKPGYLAAGLGLLAALIWKAALEAPDGKLHLFLLESTGKDSTPALLVGTPGGRYLLLGGEISTTDLTADLGRRLPLFFRRLDWWVIVNTKLGKDLPDAVQRYPPRQVLWVRMDGQDDEKAADLRNALGGTGIPVTYAEVGQVLDLGSKARLRVAKAGEGGPVLLLEWGNFQARLPFGTEAGGLEGEKVSALVLNGEELAKSDVQAYAAGLQPQVILVHGDVPLAAAQALQGYNLFSTGAHGWIHLSTDGEQMWVEAEKSSDR
jgi:competence protein ComEC